MTPFNEILKDLAPNDLPAAVCIVVMAKGSAPAREGAKMLVFKDGSIRGTIGGGNLEKQVIKDALKVIEQNQPELFRHDLLHQHQMCCGGNVQVYIEPIMRKNKLYIFGAGHTGKALASLAPGLGFETFVIDDRREYIEQLEIKGIHKMNLPFDKALRALPFDEQTYIAILTYSHHMDREILFYCIKKPHAYLGMIGSRRKVELTKKMLLESGITNEETISKVNMPIGIDINAETPEEIAVSISGMLIKKKQQVLSSRRQRQEAGHLIT